MSAAMRILIVLASVLALLIVGVVGFVVHRESQRGATGNPSAGTLATALPIATISTGDRVDVAAHIPRDGYTVVMFTGDF